MPAKLTRKGIRLILCCLLLSGTSTSDRSRALAQQWLNQGKPSTGASTVRQRQKPEPKDDSQAERTTKREPVQLPDFPLYSGKTRWRYTIVCPKVKSGPTYTMRFETKEDPATVLQWYNSALSVGRWKVKTTGASISGRSPDGNTCVVNCYGINSQGFKSNVTVVYQQLREK